MTKTMTLRLEDESAAVLELVARVDGKSQTEVIKDALDEHIDRRRSDQEFVERLRDRHQQESELYERLGQ
jgi:hypothetical protein